jgi:energy-coupling factor transporter ATP-binding protein EcfA2
MPAPVYARHVSSNVKKGVDVDLSRLTLLVGPNGSGKTSVQNALELALCGFASDVEGRDKVKLAHALARLGPGDQPLISKVTLSDGRDASWTLKPNKKGGFHDPEHVPPNGIRVIFPVADVREVLGSSPETIRTWLMGRVSADVREQDIVARLPDDLHDEYRNVASKFRTMSGWSEIDILLAVIEECKKEARKLDAQNKGSKQTMDTMSEGLASEPSAAEIEAAEAEVSSAEREYQSAMMAPRHVAPDTSQMRARAEAVVLEFQKAAETARLAHAAIPPLHAQEEALIDFRGKLADICSLTAAMGAQNCLCCDSPLAVDLSPRANLLRRENEAGSAAVAARRLSEQKQREADELRGRAEHLVKLYQAGDA